VAEGSPPVDVPEAGVEARSRSNTLAAQSAEIVARENLVYPFSPRSWQEEDHSCEHDG
jgi:hypothetical protein